MTSRSLVASRSVLRRTERPSPVFMSTWLQRQALQHPGRRVPAPSVQERRILRGHRQRGVQVCLRGRVRRSDVRPPAQLVRGTPVPQRWQVRGAATTGQRQAAPVNATPPSHEQTKDKETSEKEQTTTTTAAAAEVSEPAIVREYALHFFSRASRMLRGATQPVRMPCVCVWKFFFRPTLISKLV